MKRMWIEERDGRLVLIEEGWEGGGIDSFEDIEELEGYVAGSEQIAVAERAALEAWKAGSGGPRRGG